MLEKNPINVILVVKLLHRVVSYSVILEHVLALERCPTNVTLVVRVIYTMVVYSVISEHILEENHTNVIFVVMLLHRVVI